MRQLALDICSEWFTVHKFEREEVLFEWELKVDGETYWEPIIYKKRQPDHPRVRGTNVEKFTEIVYAFGSLTYNTTYSSYNDTIQESDFSTDVVQDGHREVQEARHETYILETTDTFVEKWEKEYFEDVDCWIWVGWNDDDDEYGYFYFEEDNKGIWDPPKCVGDHPFRMKAKTGWWFING